MKKFSISTLLLLLLLVAVCPGAMAQDNVTAITYQASVPLGDFSDYIAKTSWIGWGLEGRRFRSPTSPVTIGFAFAWHVFDDKLYGTQEVDKGAVTGTQRRWVNSLPMLITFDYYLGRKNAVSWFVGAGAGAYYIVQRFDIGVYAWEKSNWHFGVAPEVGVQFPLGDIDGILGLKYHYAFAAGESIQGDAQEFTYIAAYVGLAYERW
jgi:hypothetical protein